VGLTNTVVNALVANDMDLFAGTSSGGVFLSTNSGASWTAVNLGLRDPFVNALAYSGRNLFAATRDSGVYLSTNNGTSWTAINTGLTSLSVWSLAVSGTNIFAGILGGIYLSTNNGTTWAKVLSLSGTHVWDFAVSGTNIVAGVSTGAVYGVYLSTNNGTSWNPSTSGLPPNWDVNALAVRGTNLFAGTFGGVFLSTNNGASWAAVNLGLPDTSYINALIINGNYLFAGTWNNGGVWRRPLSEMITSVERLSTDLPTHFNLDQNYPNPFNPSTTIQYGLPARSTVRLVIYNVLGQTIKELINSEQQAGYQSLVWNANVSSGMYFYRLEAVSNETNSKRFVGTKKMLLLR
jgi:hypothetical protein